MIFSSLLFIFAFLPVSIMIFYLLPKRHRNTVLLLISMVFCAAISLYFLAYMIIYTVFNFAMGHAVGKLSKHRILSTAAAFTAIASDVAALIIFRSEQLSIIDIPDYAAELIAPVGIAFLSLNSIGYILDVFSGKIETKKNFRSFALYFFMFTKLPAGPIVNYSDYSKMLEKSKGDIESIGAGIEKFVIGLVKKVLFADNLYILYSAAASSEVGSLSALSAWLGVISYMLCLYFTLSGVSDMGAGLSMCFGFEMPESFGYPCVSIGIGDFAQKWHIPVVSWFEEHLVKPIGRISSSKLINSFAVIYAWICIGLWYELSLNKLVCGFIIGAAFVIEARTKDKNTLRMTALIYTTLILSVSAVFFFGNSISYSFRYFLAMIGGNSNIADSNSFYLLKTYIAVLLISLYVSTGLFGNLIEKSGSKVLKGAVNLISPAVTMLMFGICIASISYNGSSEMILLHL